MKLFHGSYSTSAPEIKVGSFAMSGDNVFDGIFASADTGVAESHGNNVFAYNVDKVATNADLNDRIEDIIAFLSTEIEADEVEDLANAIADDECDDAFESVLTPRSDVGGYAAASWEMQRLRGRVAAHLGFDAVEMEDEHGTSYLIVNPSIRGE